MENQNGIALVPVYQICVDKIREDNISGRLYCGKIPQGLTFSGIGEVILTIDKIMDEIGFPQSTVDKRSFGEKEEPAATLTPAAGKEAQMAMRRFNTSGQNGEYATFILQVQFRQNASWQGMVEWVENKESFPFNSELELMRIIDGACNKINTDNLEERTITQ